MARSGWPSRLYGLARFLVELERGAGGTRVYYLATAPQFYEQAIERLGQSGLAAENGGRRRVIIEKPFGTDLASARHLNQFLHKVFREHQVYRIAHYLGKETVQNLLVLRFANSIFEPIWNRNYVDRVEVTVAQELDTVTVEVSDDAPPAPARRHRRGGYGLLGMRERLEALGGTLRAGPRPGPGGWSVLATLPLPPQAARSTRPVPTRSFTHRPAPSVDDHPGERP